MTVAPCLPADPLGKKLLVMGDINAGKTTLCRQWLARLCAHGLGARIVVLDLAPDIPPALAQARGLAGAGGYLLPPPDSDVLDLRTHLHAPRLSSATEAEAEEKAAENARAIEALFDQLPDRPLGVVIAGLPGPQRSRAPGSGALQRSRQRAPRGPLATGAQPGTSMCAASQCADQGPAAGQ